MYVCVRASVICTGCQQEERRRIDQSKEKSLSTKRQNNYLQIEAFTLIKFSEPHHFESRLVCSLNLPISSYMTNK